MGIKYNCENCRHRCVTDDQYLNKPYRNMWEEESDFNCLVTDDELDTKLDRPECYEPRKVEK